MGWRGEHTDNYTTTTVQTLDKKSKEKGNMLWPNFDSVG
jgi:hypothetical protein